MMDPELFPFPITEEHVLALRDEHRAAFEAELTARAALSQVHSEYERARVRADRCTREWLEACRALELQDLATRAEPAVDALLVPFPSVHPPA